MQLEALTAKAASEHPELPIEKVLAVLRENYRGIGTVYAPAEVAGLAEIADLSLILRTLDLLSKRPYEILDCRWVFIDDADVIYELEDEIVSETYSSGVFYHPKTGDVISNYTEVLRLLYEATRIFEAICEETEKKKNPIPHERTTPLSTVIRILGESYKPKPQLEYAVDFLHDLIKIGVPSLERSAKNHRDTKEDALTDTLVAPLLAGHPHIARESDSAGHVDIVVTQPFQSKHSLLGEAKIIDSRGFPWYRKGLIVLVSKYNRGRDPLGLMMGYCRKQDLETTALEIMTAIENERIAGFIEFVPTSKYQLTGDAFDRVHAPAELDRGFRLNWTVDSGRIGLRIPAELDRRFRPIGPDSSVV